MRPEIHLRLLLALTFATGVVDAVSYLSLDGVFAGNMTGNVIIIGAAVTGADHLPTVGPGVALACFVLGAAAGGRVLRSSPPGWNVRHTALIGGGGLATAGSGVALFAGGDSVAVAGVLAFAMGTQAAAARELAVKDVTTVVVTSTMTAFAADSPLGAGRAQPWPRRAGAIALMTAGAAVGAALIRLAPGWALLVAAAAALSTALAGARATAKSSDRSP
ncbi:YoaK family protein [Streptomyces sp. NPDC127098]|uniref:YoaK family protein n=1 Tax=Streptomyces sp. NPDC127098 TaxID=3347137 RepID=UPI00364B8E21